MIFVDLAAALHTYILKRYLSDLDRPLSNPKFQSIYLFGRLMEPALSRPEGLFHHVFIRLFSLADLPSIPSLQRSLWANFPTRWEVWKPKMHPEAIELKQPKPPRGFEVFSATSWPPRETLRYDFLGPKKKGASRSGVFFLELCQKAEIFPRFWLKI